MSIKQKSLSDEVIIDEETFLVDLKTHNEKMGPYMIAPPEVGGIGKEVEYGEKRYLINNKVLRAKYAISFLSTHDTPQAGARIAEEEESQPRLSQT